MKITSSRTGFVHMLVVACFALAPSAGIANNDYTKTVADGIADVALTANDTIITDKLSGDGVDTLRFTRTSDFYSVKLRSAGGNDLPGGIIADGFLLKIQNPDVLGTGPVLLKNQWSGLFGDVWSSLDAIDVRNRVVFDTADSFAAGENAKKLVLHNIGTTEANAGKIVTLGRDGTGVANVTLSLDGSENDAIGSFNLRGDLSLTIDGGTLRAAATGGDRDLFQKANAQATPKITIENAPLAIDVARGGGGGSVGFGISPSYASDKKITVLAEEYKPTNWSFEAGNTDWTFSNGGVYTKGAAFDANGAWPPNDGDKYAMVRNGATLTRNIDIPSDGEWRVVLEQGCRDGNYSLNIETTVTIDANTVLVIPKITEAAEAHGFEEFRGEPLQLAKGTHSFAISLSSTGGYGSLNFDAIRFERYETSVPGHEIVKTGEGELALVDGDFPADGSDMAVTAAGGTVSVSGAVLNGCSFTAALGATLSFSGVTANGTGIAVAAGGTLVLDAPGKNIVENGGFETPVVSDYGFQWKSECAWTLEPSAEPRPAIQHNGGTLTRSADQTPYGQQSLFLRTGTSASQTIHASAAGDYVLSFWQASRNYASSYELALKVIVDGAEAVLNEGQSARYEPYRTSKTIALAEGDHTLAFECQADGKAGSGIFIDDVSLAPAMPPSDLAAASLALESGSTLRINRPENGKLAIGSVTVDGAPVRGGRSALTAAGVVVEGEGRINCGKPFGISIFLR